MKKKKAEIERENLRMQLELTRINRDSSTSVSIQNFIQLIHDKIADFKKEVTVKNLKLNFKFEESSNYDFWWDEVIYSSSSYQDKEHS